MKRGKNNGTANEYQGLKVIAKKVWIVYHLLFTSSLAVEHGLEEVETAEKDLLQPPTWRILETEASKRYRLQIQEWSFIQPNL